MKARGASGSDILIAIAVVACLAIGAGLTYFLTREPAASPRAPMPVAEGKPLLELGKSSAPVVAMKPSDSAPAPASTDEGEYLKLGFETLSSYFYATPSMDNAQNPERKRDKQIPSPVRNLNGKKVTVTGFMKPLDIDTSGGVKSFMLLKDTSVCCYGRLPRMNEWVRVQMREGKTAAFIPDQPITVIGTLEVGEDIQKGVVLSIYRLHAEDVAGPMDL
jgi:hypothetical protein